MVGLLRLHWFGRWGTRVVAFETCVRQWTLGSAIYVVETQARCGLRRFRQLAADA